MDAPTTVAELLRLVREAHEEYSVAIGTLSPDALMEPDAIGTWSVRDVIAHVGADELWMTGQLEALRFGTLPTVASCYGIDKPPAADMDWNSQDARNDWQRDRLRDLSLDDVRAMANEAHAHLLAVIAALDEAQLVEKLAIGQLGTVGHIRPPNEGEPAYPMWEWLRGVTYHHYADHAKALREAGAKVSQA